MKRNKTYMIRRTLLLLCMMVSTTMAWADVEVGTAAELKEQLESQTISGTVRLTANINLSEVIVLHDSRTITLDLAGHDITATDCRALWIKNGNLTIQSSVGEGKISVVGTNVNADSSVLRVGKDESDVNEAYLSIDENVKIETTLCYGVTIFGLNVEKLVVNGKVETKVRPAISGNGTAGLASTTITIGEKAVISTTDDVAIYHPQAGTLTIKGNVAETEAGITGAGGIEMKGGELIVEDYAKIQATGTISHTANNDGTSTRGYAIAIVENGLYKGVSTVNISKNATIVGPIAVVKDSDKNNEAPDITFDAGGLQMLVKVTDSSDKQFGQYMTLEDAFREAPAGSTIKLLDKIDGKIILSSTIETTKDYTLDLNGKTIESDGHRAFYIKSGEVTIESTATAPAIGTIYVPSIENNDQSVIRVGSSESAAAKLTVGENVTISADECYGITIFGKNTAEELTVNGNVNTKIRPAISGNGSSGLASTTITIGATAKILTTDEVAIYQPQAGKLTIKGEADVTGNGGIEIKGGSLIVEANAKITATGTPAHTPCDDGTSTRGYAIAIVENNSQNGAYGGGYGVSAVTISNDAKIKGPIAELQDSQRSSFSPTYNGNAVSKKVAAIDKDEYFTLKDAVDIVPSQQTVKLLGNLTLNTTVKMEKEKTYTLDLAGYTLTGSGCTALQIAGGHVTITNSGSEEKTITGGTTTSPVILMGDDSGESRNVSLTINEKVTVDGGTITNGILLSGSKTRETLTIKGTVQADGHIAILGSKDADRGGTKIQIATGGTVGAANAVAIYHPQSGDLIVDGTVTGTGAIEMKGGNLTVNTSAKITASGTATHTKSDVAPSTDGYAIALVEHAGFTGVGKAKISKGATITGMIACLIDSKNNDVADPVFTGDIYMVAETNIQDEFNKHGDKYATLPDAIAAASESTAEKESVVKLLDDLTVNSPIAINKAITLDMDDYSIIGTTAEATVKVSANATIKNGGISSVKNGAAGINGISVTTGTVNLEQVTVNTNGVALSVDGGTVTADAKSSFSSTADNTLALSGGTTTLSGKVYNTSTTDGKNNAIAGSGSGALTAEGTMVISSAKGNGIDWNSTGALTIKGGKVMGAEAVYASDGTITIKGGTFTGTGHALEIAGGTPSVTGGTFICGADDTANSINYEPITAASGITQFVSGGYFSQHIAPLLCDEGYMISPNPLNNGLYYLVDEVVINDGTVWTVETDPAEPYTINKATYTRNSGMGASGTHFGTLCLPFSIDPSAQGIPTGMTFYSVSGISDNKLNLTEITTTIEAGTPVIFHFNDPTSSFTIESDHATVSTAAAKEANNLVGTYAKTDITTGLSDIYFLNSDAFHQASTSLTVPAYRAYIHLTSQGSGNKPAVLYINIDGGETEGIEAVQMDNEMESIYDMQGRKQNGLRQGMNIIKMSNGKTIKVYVNK